MLKLGLSSAICVLLIVSFAYCGDKTISLVWSPSDDISHFDPIKSSKLASLHVRIKPIEDQRERISEIGKNIQRSYEKLYLTNDDVVSWTRNHFIQEVRQFGIRLDDRSPDIIVEVALIRLYVVENGTYSGEVTFKINAIDNNQKQSIWSGIISGKSTRWGHSFNAETYCECIGNAFMEAVSNFLHDESFIASIERIGQPTIPAASNASLSGTSVSGATVKKRVAVFDFEDKSNHQISWWRTEQTVGQGLSDMCISALIKTGQYTVIERERLEQILKEQALGASGAVSEQTAAEIGRLLGVEVALFGAVTEIGYREKQTNGNAPVPTPFGTTNAQFGVNTLAARVTVNARLVNTSTGEIIAAEALPAEESTTSFGISSAQTSFSSRTAFDESLVGKATKKAIDNLVSMIGLHSNAIRWQGSIVKSDGSEIIINAGSSTGIKIGDSLIVYSKGEDLVDPVTGAKLGNDEMRIGVIRVASDIAEGNASKCELVSGSCGKRGDIVRY